MKILLHYSILGIGGAERSLIRLTNYLIDRNHNLTLLLTTGGGELEKDLNPAIKLLYLRKSAYGNKFQASKGFFQKLLNSFDAFKYLLSRVREILMLVLLRRDNYDCAIVMTHGLNPVTCISYVKSRTTLQFIRNDLSSYKKRNRAVKFLKQYNKQIDAYLCVSDYARQAAESVCPSIKGKAFTIYNFYDTESIIKKSDLVINPYNGMVSDKEVIILTVARMIDDDKAIFRTIEIGTRLVNRGMKFKWFFIGDGKDKDLFIKKIENSILQNYFFILGSKDNPYPYFKHCDISATLSYYEGLCGVVSEAKILKKAVIATDFSGVREQIVSDVNGIIAMQDVDDIVIKISDLIENSLLRERLAKEELPEDLLLNEKKYNKLIKIIKIKINENEYKCSKSL